MDFKLKKAMLFSLTNFIILRTELYEIIKIDINFLFIYEYFSPRILSFTSFSYFFQLVVKSTA